MRAWITSTQRILKDSPGMASFSEDIAFDFGGLEADPVPGLTTCFPLLLDYSCHFLPWQGAQSRCQPCQASSRFSRTQLNACKLQRCPSSFLQDHTALRRVLEWGPTEEALSVSFSEINAIFACASTISSKKNQPLRPDGCHWKGGYAISELRGFADIAPESHYDILWLGHRVSL